MRSKFRCRLLQIYILLQRMVRCLYAVAFGSGFNSGTVGGTLHAAARPPVNVIFVYLGLNLLFRLQFIAQLCETR